MNYPLAVGSFAFFTLLVALLSWWRTRLADNANAKTYFLADRRLPWIQIAGSLLLTNLSTEQLIGLNGAAAVHGFVVMAWEIVPVFALILLAVYFLPKYWAGRITTIPEFLEQRYDRPTRRMLGAVLLVTLTFNFLPFILFSGGVAMSSVFQLQQNFGITDSNSFLLMACLIAVIGGFYVVFGGMKAVALSDTLYGIGLIVGALMIPFLGLRLLGEGNFTAGLARLVVNQRSMLNPIGSAESNVPFTTLFSGMLLINVFYWCTNQVIVQRAFGAASFAEAQKGVLATAGLKLLGPLFLVLPGTIALELFGTGVGNGDFAYAKLVEAVLPTYLVGFFAAVLLGSIISSFTGGLHSAATLFSLDLYRAWIRPKCTDSEMLKAGKWSAVVVCCTSILISGLLGSSADGVFTLMKRLMAGFNIPLLVVVAMGMFTTRVPAWAAKAVLTAGIGTHFLLLHLFANGTYGIRINWLHLAAGNAVLLALFMFAAAYFNRAPIVRSPANSAATMTLTPWSGLKHASLAVCAAAVLFYAVMFYIARTN